MGFSKEKTKYNKYYDDIRFLESNHRLNQFLIACVALAFHLIDKTIDNKWSRRLKSLERKGKIRERMERLSFHPVAFALIITVLAILTISISQYTIGITISYQGQDLGRIENAEEIVALCEEVEAAVTEIMGEEYKIDPEELVIYKGLIPRDEEYVTLAEISNKVYQGTGLVSYAYTLKIDDETIGSTIYKGALEDILNQLTTDHYTPNTISCGFTETIVIEEGIVANSNLTSLGSILETLHSTKTGVKIHTVVYGESWIGIAKENGLTSQELLDLNPGANMYLLHTGDELVVSEAVPYLTITQVEKESYVASIPYDIEYQDDDTMYEGNYKVLSKGVEGEADTVAEVTYVNGEETNRNIISQVITKEPITEIQAKGTVPRPSWYPTGTFSWPTSGRITSYFGSRYLFGVWRMHEGIDISCTYGTDIKASDGGVVVYSGWQGTYGYLVMIDHLNGYVTYYAHNSSLYVSKGDYVYKGQVIAGAGSTGRSTGVHCHFGITYNGSFINPLTKLP